MAAYYSCSLATDARVSQDRMCVRAVFNVCSRMCVWLYIFTRKDSAEWWSFSQAALLGGLKREACTSG